MYRCETFYKMWHQEEKLSEEVENCLNFNQISREKIIDIKTFSENDRIYCMIIWEE